MKSKTYQLLLEDRGAALVALDAAHQILDRWLLAGVEELGGVNLDLVQLPREGLVLLPHRVVGLLAAADHRWIVVSTR